MSTVRCGIVGPSGCGKTTLAEQLGGVLTSAGIRVGYIKHAAHGFTVDRAGSDSARLHAAGATELVLVGPDEQLVRTAATNAATNATTTATADDADLEVALGRLGPVDVVLIEGFSLAPHPKIRVGWADEDPRDAGGEVRLELRRPRPGHPPEATGGHNAADLHTPAQRWPEADLDAARRTVLALLDEVEPNPEVTVLADGVAVPMHRFATAVVSGTVLGLASSLKGVDDPDTLTITVRLARNREAPEG